MRTSLTGAVLLAAWTLGASQTRAQSEESLAVEARVACAAGDVDKGIKLLARILATTDDVTAVYNMGRCYQQNGRPEKAVLQFEEYLRKAKDLPPEEKAAVDASIAEAQAAAHRQKMVVPPPVETLTRVPQLTAGPVSGTNVMVGPATDDEPAERRRRKLRWAGIGAASVGALSLGTGLFFSLRTSSLDSRMEKAGNTFDPSGDKAGSRAETLQWIFYGVGAGALLGGGVLYYLGLDRNESVVIAPSISVRSASALVRVRL